MIAAIVTGAASGIGKACAQLLSLRGFAVVVADRDLAAAEDVAADIRAAGGEARAIAVDLVDPEQIEVLVAASAAWHDLGVLVNNAGVSIPAPIVDTDVAAWDLQHDVNLRGSFLMLKAVVPHLIARGGGKVVNIASTAAFISSSTPEIAYDTTKAGVRQLTVSAAAELAAQGINVNAVAPGTIATALTDTVLDTPEKRERAAAAIPAGRLGHPGDIAEAVAFLCSDGADYIHGHTLVVDGGRLAR
jgi:NAD(P)-dependent dehydrogenase (short-subunit alcohol dehydrogenase family)